MVPNKCLDIYKLDFKRSEIERTNNIRKQQTPFYLVCSCELMETLYCYSSGREYKISVACLCKSCMGNEVF